MGDPSRGPTLTAAPAQPQSPGGSLPSLVAFSTGAFLLVPAPSKTPHAARSEKEGPRRDAVWWSGREPIVAARALRICEQQGARFHVSRVACFGRSKRTRRSMRRAEKKPRNEAGPGRISKFGPVSPASRPNRGGSPQLGCGPDHSTADNSKKRDRHHSIASYSSIPCAQIEARFPCANTAALQLPLPYWRWPRFSGSHPGPLKPTGPDRSAQAQAQPSSLCRRFGDTGPQKENAPPIRAGHYNCRSPRRVAGRERPFQPTRKIVRIRTQRERPSMGYRSAWIER